MKPRALDLFCGACGGWSLGMHRAGIETVAACEIDPWRRAQFSRNFPNVRMYDDVRTLTAERLRADGISIDGVFGSPPCQDASSANTKGRGIDGERTGLYLEAVRIVIECGVSWAAFENVPGIRSRGIDRVLGLLEQAGYACWPLVVGASDLGAPHLRKRSWVVCADTETVQRLAQPWRESDGDNELAVADMPRDGRRSGRSRRFDSSAAGEQGGFDARASAIADKTERRPIDSARRNDRTDSLSQGQESPGRFEAGAAPASDADQGTIRQSILPRRSEPQTAEPEEQSTRQPGGAGLEIERGESGDDGAELTPLERAIAERCGSVAQNWNGGIAGCERVANGLPKGMAQPLLSAYGDAVVPQIAEIIGHAILLGIYAEAA